MAGWRVDLDGTRGSVRLDLDMARVRLRAARERLRDRCRALRPAVVRAPSEETVCVYVVWRPGETTAF